MQENNYILLLHKRFSGEISAGESALLDAWIAQSDQNVALARQYRLIWDSAETVQKTFALDLDEEYRQLQQRLATADMPRGRVLPIRYYLLRIAAAIALLLVAVWGFRAFRLAPEAGHMERIVATENKLLQLPDGSRVWLRPNGAIEYPAVFDARLRRVRLDGEAYFSVAHNPAQPFHIELVSGGTIDVLGTEFNVKAYSGQPEATVLVREGKVRFSPAGNNSAPVLQARDRAVFNRSKATLHLSKVATFNELSWKTGGLEFVRTPLEIVIADLEKYYQVKIELRNPALRSCLHTAPLTNQPIERVLESLSLTYQMQVVHPAPGQFILTGGSCL